MGRETMIKLSFGLAWVFRVVALGLISVILFFVKDTWQDFKDMKRDVQSQKEWQAAQAEKNKDFERRITQIETQ